MRCLFVVALATLGVGCGDGGVDAVSSAGPWPRAGASAEAGAAAWSEAGGGADAGTVRNGEADAAPGTDAGPTGNASDAAACVACDDFEHGTVGQPPGGPWTVATPNCSGSGVVVIDDTQAHGGTHSVKVTGAGGYCNHVFFAAPIAAARPVTWIRFFIRLDSALGDGHTTFLAMRDAHEGKDLRMGGQNRVLMFNRESDDATLPDMSPAGTALSVAPPAQAWTCIEAAIDASAKSIRTWVNGVGVDGLVVDGVATPHVDATWLRDTTWAPDLTDVRFGWESYAGQVDTLWFDDVAIGTARFGCGA